MSKKFYLGLILLSPILTMLILSIGSIFIVSLLGSLNMIINMNNLEKTKLLIAIILMIMSITGFLLVFNELVNSIIEDEKKEINK